MPVMVSTGGCSWLLFSCIPEIVAKSIIPAVSRDFDIPVQTIFIDEQTGRAGSNPAGGRRSFCNGGVNVAKQLLGEGVASMIDAYLGVDVGSVSTNLVIMDKEGQLLAVRYLRTNGRPIQTVQEGIQSLGRELAQEVNIIGCGATGSARYLTSMIIGADVVKNEITAHAIAATHEIGEVNTIIEIGGQDSKIIILRDGVVTDFAMNTVCAAGTGSFLDQQAQRLCIPIEEFGGYAVRARNPVRIAGRCAVFAESDMIHKQQLGHNLEDIIAGLCEALVRNYMNNVGKGKEILAPVVFQGGVAANIGLVQAFNKYLGIEVMVPKHHGVMGLSEPPTWPGMQWAKQEKPTSKALTCKRLNLKPPVLNVKVALMPVKWYSSLRTIIWYPAGETAVANGSCRWVKHTWRALAPCYGGVKIKAKKEDER